MNILRNPIYIAFGFMALMAVGCQNSNVTDTVEESSALKPAPTVDCPDSRHAALEVDMVDLVSTPEKFEGVKIKTVGFYYRRFEHSALYPDRRDPDTTLFSEGVWLKGMHSFTDLSDHRVRVEGEFTTKSQGHLGQWPGSICVLKASTAAIK